MILCFTWTTIFAADNVVSPTIYDNTYNVYVVSADRVNKASLLLLDFKKTYDLCKENEGFYTQKLQKTNDLWSQKFDIKTGEDGAVIKGLKDELKDKSIWYKQWYVVLPVTMISTVVLLSYINK